MPQIQQVQQQPAPGGSQGQTPTAEIAAAVAQAMAQAMPQPQQPQQQLTQEQIDQMLGTYNPDQALHDAMFSPNTTPEARMQAMVQWTRGVVANATQHAQVIAQDTARQLYSHIQEPLEDARSYGQDRLFQKLYDGHDGLKKFDPMIRGTLSSVEQMQGFPRERDKRVEFIRNHYVQMLKQQDPNFDPVGHQAQQQQQGQRGSYAPGYGQQQPSQQQGNPLPHSHAFSGQPQQQNRQPQAQPSLASFASGGQGSAAPTQQGGSSDRAWDTNGHGF